jgi:serine/threonine protein kinase
MESTSCPSCGQTVLDIDVRCNACGHAVSSTGAQRMLGQVVLGQYELVDVLGQGGMSVVYQGKHRITEQQVALKILPPELAAHSQVKSRFLEEARALAQLDHPNIVHLYNFGPQDNGSFVLAMQFVIGKTWERLIVESERLSWQVTLRIAIDVLKALEYAHGRGVIHRDMKPSNVLVREQDGAATVMDFGIAKMTTSSRLTATGQTMGTVRYMSPEQVRGQEVDASTDLYSLGATIYESLTGETPFDGSTHFEIMSKHLTDAPVPPSKRGAVLPPELEQGLLRCLAKKPADRFGNAREVRKLFEAVLRENDAGLEDTQRVSRDLLLDSVNRSVAHATAQGKTGDSSPGGGGGGGGGGGAAAGLAELASALAGESSPGARRVGTAESLPAAVARTEGERTGGRRWGVWIGALAVLAGGGAVAVLMLMRDDGTRAAPRWEPEVGTLTRELRVADLGALIRTPEGVAPGQVESVYRSEWEGYGAFLRERGVEPVPPSVIQGIAVVPREALCAPSTYSGVAPPASCGKSVHVFRVIDQVLVITEAPSDWPAALRLGISEAVCAARPTTCDLAADFTPKSDAGPVK